MEKLNEGDVIRINDDVPHPSFAGALTRIKYRIEGNADGATAYMVYVSHPRLTELILFDDEFTLVAKADKGE